MTAPIRFHNTLTGQIESFSPLQSGMASMYVCGVTPYDHCHVGHARCYTVFDIIRRTFLKAGYQVKYIQNFTDIDDKIIARAQKEKVSPESVAEKYTQDYFDKMKRLNILEASAYPRATQNLPGIITMIQKLIDRGLAYAVEGDVYYAVRKFPSYTKLSNKPIDDLIAGARVEPGDKKKDPLDFALWKKAKEGEPSWESPWGNGRPGWHIECSVMSMAHLGETFDIHGGGLDLIFPHHENEIAQSEGQTSKPFARYWIHNGFVTVDKTKMSKSLGNFFTLQEVYDQFDPMVLRYFLISQHYRSPLEFSDKALQQTKNTWDGILQASQNARHYLSQHPGEANPSERWTKYKNEFDHALREDFNTPQALAAIHKVIGEINRLMASQPNGKTAHDIATGHSLLIELLDVLGLDLEETAPLPTEVESLIKRREEARRRHQFQEADQVRTKLRDLGYTIEDTPSGPRLIKIH